MKISRKISLAAFATAALITAPWLAVAQAPGPKPLSGLWDAAVTVNGTEIPFRLRLNQAKGAIGGTFFDGDRPINPSSRGSFKDGDLDLAFDSYATRLTAHLDHGVLKGIYGSSRSSFPFEARPHREGAAVAAKAPAVAGVWEIPVETAKGEKAWRLITRQAGGRLYASVLRVDGDTGTLDGVWRDGKFRLSRFAGERPGLLEVTPNKDGSLGLLLIDSSSRRELRAVRPATARKDGLAAPTDPAHHTTVKDPSEPFHFAAPDLGGRPVADTDARFKGKVVLVNIMGSWCPNCHDEAPFLASLYDRYKARGLEIVALDFEQPDQLKDPARLRAFLAKYKIKYTVLLAGDTKDLNQEIPQAVNLNAWPTTFFLGRDGRVKSVHVGFTSPGSGTYDAKLKADIAREVEGLLAEKG